MPQDSHHHFLSYARTDNRTGRVSDFAGRLTAAYRAATGRDLLIFFDADSLEGGNRWLHHILRQLNQSKILLACLSPAYLESEFCRREFAEYLKGETGRGLSSSGILPVWAFDIPNWQDRAYDDDAPDWVRLLRQRNYIDLRVAFGSTEPSSAEPARTARLIEQIAARIRRVEAAERSPSWTLPPHNERFTGREDDMAGVGPRNRVTATES